MGVGHAVWWNMDISSDSIYIDCNKVDIQEFKNFFDSGEKDGEKNGKNECGSSDRTAEHLL